MASYFDEHNCEPTNPEEQYRQNALLELARLDWAHLRHIVMIYIDNVQCCDWLLVFVCRSLMQGLDLFDSGAFDLSDWDHCLPPPAAKTAVQTLTVVIISPEQAGDGDRRLLQ